MSYLNTPRLHFAGRFQADPSTNNDSNFNPLPLGSQPPNPLDPANTSVYWNPNGSHHWKLIDCKVTGAADDDGPFKHPGADPIIGAQVVSSGRYPAKLVDLDPDNQRVSQIWGLQVQIRILDPKDSTKVLASVTGNMPPTAFGDLWNRTTNAPRPGVSTMGAAFQAVLENVAWVNPSTSRLLDALQKVSPKNLSIRFNVDSYQPDATQPNFTSGRVVGTIGPVLPGEAPRSTPRRLAPVYSTQSGNANCLTIMSTYGPAGAVWDARRNVIICDLGNSIPTVWSAQTSGPSVPDAGWPTITASCQFSCGGTAIGLAPANSMKTGASSLSTDNGVSPRGIVHFDTQTYLTYAGVVEFAVPEYQVSLVETSPLTLTNLTAGQTAVQEDPAGRYVDVDPPFLRMNPGETADVRLWATKFGMPWSGVTLPVGLLPISPAGIRGLWNNNDPQNGLTLSSNAVITGTDGTGVLHLKANDPGVPRSYPNGRPGLDGQIYGISSFAPIPDQPAQLDALWPALGQIFLFAGAPINVLVFSSYRMPDNPTWSQHVGPIFSRYARMYHYMNEIIDLADYDTVKRNCDDIQIQLNLSPENPHYMPVSRDLSSGKLAMINRWFELGMPK